MLVLVRSEALECFVAAAAEAGLQPDEGLRLGVERALLLADLAALGADSGVARRLLRGAASRARVDRELTVDLSTWVRRLCLRTPIAAPHLDEEVSVALPDRLLVRAGRELRARSLRAEAVPEMVAWEIAAAISGRSMAEWGLREASSAFR